jgi:uncharacterized protein (DUF58 family)
MRLNSTIKKIQNWFYGGPDWIEIPSFIISSRRYKSPTVLFFLWLYAYYVRMFTVPGRMLVSVSLIIFSYAAISIRSPVRVLAFTMGAIFIIEFIIGFIFRPKLKITRQIPERVRAATPVQADYQLSNRKRFPAWNVSMDSHLYSQCGRQHLEFASTDYIPGRETVSVSAKLFFERRGKYRLGSPIAEGTFPFGILKWSCRQKQPNEILVYPSYEPIDFLSLPLGRRYQKEGNALISKVGESMDFLGCREFRTGDDPKYIHWPSSARTGELIVKEFQDEHLTRIAMIVDTYVPKPGLMDKLMNKGRFSIELEAAVSLVASIADLLSRGDYVIDIFAAGPDIYHFQSGRSLGYFDNILDILACLEPNHDQPIHKLSPTVMQEISGIGSAVLVLLDWNEERERLVQKLQSNGVATKIIIIETKAMKSPAPEGAICLTAESIFRGEVKSL